MIASANFAECPMPLDPSEKIGVAQIAIENRQSEAQVRRYFENGVYFAHEFGGHNGQAKLSFRGSIKARLKARGLIERRIQKPVPLKSIGSYYRFACEEDDSFILSRMFENFDEDEIAAAIAGKVCDRYFNKS